MDFTQTDEESVKLYQKLYGGNYTYLGTVGAKSEIYPLYQHDNRDVDEIIMTHSGLRLFGVVSIL